MTDTPGDGDRTLRMQGGGALRPGNVVGDRYRLEERLGEGAMGEVWLAYDLKLCVEVALKRLHSHLIADERHATMLRHEVRAARDVTSSNVCRIYDLVESEFGEMISMEYVDGWSLADILTDRGPLDLIEAADIASQMLSGLGIIHQAGLIHRDLKPANVMITRSGRAVLMDFGVARWADATQRQSIAGTPAYMAPEQMRGGELDARSDIYAMGLLLAEMSIAEALSTLDERRALWERLRSEPPQVPKGPWRAMIQRCVATDPERRFASTAECARALEESLYRTGELDEEESPYPGLTTFAEKDARFFFGRELEVESAWKKLQRAPMVAIIGPSGVGKSSFVRAGLLPAQPDGWDCVVCAPGRSPMLSLAQALATRFAGDAQAVQQLLNFEDMDNVVQIVARWRSEHGQVLLVLDQFEELFTQNSEDVQAHFAQLLGRLNLEADIHVLVSMRDDFFFLCHRHPELSPLFVDPLPLAPLSGDDLRRALVQPAQLSGYHFESASLVEDMLEPVSRERGALPLLAFAAARLWERRSPARGQLTREAYEAIGGVEGALAQHAERVMERIGVEREDIVREIFRNLITAHRTRVARQREELLSVFEDRDTAASVLNELIDARLLISYEMHNEDGEANHEVEIIHESLLRAWPRLVRWQTQDDDGAQLRDQFRQAAQLWEERSRSQDLLWSGTAYQEFELWRDRYEGGLSDTEESFAESMVAHESRRRRRRKTALTSVFVVMLTVLAVVSKLKLDADAAATRANEEKQQTLAVRFEELSKDQLEKDNSVALAFAIAGLEQSDKPTLRSLALEALWSGPTRFHPEIFDWGVGNGGGSAFSPDGRWFAASSRDSGIVAWPSDGSDPIPNLSPTLSTAGERRQVGGFSPDGTKLLVSMTSNYREEGEAWSLVSQISFPDGEPLWSARVDTFAEVFAPVRAGNPFTMGLIIDGTYTYEHWDLDGKRRLRLGTVSTRRDGYGISMESGDQRWVAWARGNRVFLSPSDSLGTSRGKLIGTLDRPVRRVGVSHSGDVVAASDDTGMTAIWSLEEGGTQRLPLRRQLEEADLWYMDFDLARRRMITMANQQTRVLRLDGPAASSTLALLPSFAQPDWAVRHPSLDWLAVTNTFRPGWLLFYPMRNLHPYHLSPLQLEHPEWRFTRPGPDGKELMMIDGAGAWLVDLSSPDLERRHIFTDPVRATYCWTFGPRNERVAFGGFMSGVWVVSLVGAEAIHLKAPPYHISAVSFSPSGRSIATGGGVFAGESTGIIRIFDATGTESQELGRCHDHGEDRGEVTELIFLTESTLLSGCSAGGLIWDLENGDSRLFHEDKIGINQLEVSEHFIAAISSTGVTLYDRSSFAEQHLRLPGPPFTIWALAISPDESFIVAGYNNGAIRVHYLDQQSPHHLLRQPGPVWGLWIDPKSNWILASTRDGHASYWPVPRGRPLFDRPIDEFLAILKAQTNLRIAVDIDSPVGYRYTDSAFPGWDTVPTWQEWNTEEHLVDPPWEPILDAGDW